MPTDREALIRAHVAAAPTAVWWKRLPVIRHARYWRTMVAINRHYDWWLAFGSLPVNADLDYAVADAIWRGEK